jgi:hypothetical protein
MNKTFKDIPYLPAEGVPQDPWETATTYFEYLTMSETLGGAVWMSGSDYQRKRIIAKFEAQWEECLLAQLPWSKFFLQIIERIVAILSSYQSASTIATEEDLDSKSLPVFTEKDDDLNGASYKPRAGSTNRNTGSAPSLAGEKTGVENSMGILRKTTAKLGTSLTTPKAGATQKKSSGLQGGQVDPRMVWIKVDVEALRAKGKAPKSHRSTFIDLRRHHRFGNEDIIPEQLGAAGEELPFSDETDADAIIHLRDSKAGSTGNNRVSRQPEAYVPPPGTVADHPSEYSKDKDFEKGQFKVGQSRINIKFTQRLNLHSMRLTHSS